jgi:hypothetical protein
LSITKQKELYSKVARKVFEEATVTSLGSTFHIIIAFHLKQKFNRDPYEVLITDPKTFYNGLKEVLGAGAEAVIALVGTHLTLKYSTNCTSQEFVALFTIDEKLSTQKLTELFGNVVHQETTKLKEK